MSKTVDSTGVDIVLRNVILGFPVGACMVHLSFSLHHSCTLLSFHQCLFLLPMVSVGMEVSFSPLLDLLQLCI